MLWKTAIATYHYFKNKLIKQNSLQETHTGIQFIAEKGMIEHQVKDSLV